MPLGNSITQGEASSVASDGLAHNTWRRKLWQQLADRMGHDIDFIGTLDQAYPCEDYPDTDFDWDHEGHWAWTIDEVLYGRTGSCNGSGRIGQWLSTAGLPDYILIHLGTNDCWGGQSVSSSVSELEALIDTLQAYHMNMTILLAQIIGHEDVIVDACIQQLNDSIPVIASRKATSQSNIVVVDQYSGFDPSTDLYDTAHPNDSGEIKIFRKWFEALDPLLSGASLPVELSTFQIEKQKKGVEVSWSTVSEVGTDCFIIERKDPGLEFKEISHRMAEGGEHVTTHYQYLDASFPNKSGYYHYRLKMMDVDGSVDWSPTQIISIEDEEPIQIWPTILRSSDPILHVRSKANCHIQVLDVQGRLCFSIDFSAQMKELSLPAISQGLYYLQIYHTAKAKTIPIVVL